MCIRDRISDASGPSRYPQQIKIYDFENPRWKNEKILISSQPIGRIWQSLARWCVWTLSTKIASKISRFQKSKMAVAAILKICKIAISPQWDDRFWWNLVQWCVWALQIPSTNKNSRFRKSKMAAAAILKNWKILISLQPIDRFWLYFARWCASTLWTPLDDKIWWFQKSKMAAAAIWTSGSAVAEGPRDVLVSRNSATCKTSHLKTIVWHYLQTDGQTHADGIYRA